MFATISMSGTIFVKKNSTEEELKGLKDLLQKIGDVTTFESINDYQFELTDHSDTSDHVDDNEEILQEVYKEFSSIISSGYIYFQELTPSDTPVYRFLYNDEKGFVLQFPQIVYDQI